MALRNEDHIQTKASGQCSYPSEQVQTLHFGDRKASLFRAIHSSNDHFQYHCTLSQVEWLRLNCDIGDQYPELCIHWNLHCRDVYKTNSLRSTYLL